MSRTNRIDNQFIKLSKMKTTSTILPATAANISTKGAATIYPDVYAHEEDNTKFFEEARAFRTEAVAGRGREEKLVERFGKTATAIRIQVVERRMIARARQRSLNAQYPGSMRGEQDEQRTRRSARRWLAFTKRVHASGGDSASAARPRARWRRRWIRSVHGHGRHSGGRSGSRAGHWSSWGRARRRRCVCELVGAAC